MYDREEKITCHAMTHMQYIRIWCGWIGIARSTTCHTSLRRGCHAHAYPSACPSLHMHVALRILYPVPHAHVHARMHAFQPFVCIAR